MPARISTELRFRFPDEDDLAGWVRASEFTRENPRFLRYLRRTDEAAHRRFVAGLHKVSIRARQHAWRDPRMGARPAQLLPGTPGSFSDRNDWATWLIVGGRGSGKSRTGAEGVREILFGRRWRTNPKGALVGQTLDAVRVDMVENTLLPILPPGSVRQWNRGTCELWVDLGDVEIRSKRAVRRVPRVAYLRGFSSEAARKLRGQNVHFAWGDELATWRDADRSPNADSATWSNLKMAVRLDDRHPYESRGSWKPRIIATTTPKAVRLLRNLDPNDIQNPGPGLYDAETTVISNMSTLDNVANLSAHFYETTIRPLEGTRLYDQEVLGVLLSEALGALWSDELIRQMSRHSSGIGAQVDLVRTVIGVDPSVGAGRGDECGIVALGLGTDGRAYILEDASIRARASEWCRVVRDLFTKWNATAVAVEVNQGGELVEETLGRYAPHLPIVEVWAKKGKILRAEAAALLSDRDLLRFALSGDFDRLIQQMKTYEGDGPSPDRLDAMVYGCLWLLPAETGAAGLISTFGTGTRTFQLA